MRHAVVLTLVLALAACAANDSPDEPGDVLITPAHLDDLELTPGIRTLEFETGGKEQRLVVAVPDPAPTGDVPLVLALHWYTPAADDPAGDFLRSFAEPGLRDLGAIIVAPESQHGRWTGEDVARTLRSLVRSACAAWPVDPDRVVVTGYSMGGVGTWYLVSLYPGLFSAAIPVAGEPGGVLEPSVPLYAIQGEFDAMFPVAAVEEAVDELVRRGGDARIVVAEGLAHHQAGGYLPYLAAAADWLAGEVWTGR